MAERGSERIAAAFEAAAGEGRSALMPYLVGGYPDRAGSMAIAGAYVDAGADLVEIGIPYSDPLADGPVIQEAASAALAAGIGTSDVLEVAASISDRVPVILLAYAGLVVGGDGPDAFAERAVAAGVCGVVIPDLPLGTDESIRQALSAAGLAVIPLVAPTTSPERRSRILEVADGFVYLVSDVGTTGERGSLPPALPELVDALLQDVVGVADGALGVAPELGDDVGVGVVDLDGPLAAAGEDGGQPPAGVLFPVGFGEEGDEVGVTVGLPRVGGGQRLVEGGVLGVVGQGA